MHEWWVSETELDDEQRRIIELSADGRYLVIGPPGSGKTNLLLLRANYLSVSDKPNLIILVFTRTLREFIVSGGRRYSFPSEKIQTYSAWGKRLLYEHGINVPSSADFDTDRHNLLEALNGLINEERITDQYYDAILIDEAHDYLPEEIETIMKFSANIFAVADARQQIYRKRDTRAIDLLRSVSVTKELRHHYRNGIKICQLADNIMKGQALYSQMEPTSRYDELARPSSVRHFRCSDLNEQLDNLIGDLRTQLDAYPSELLGVVCPCREELEPIRNGLLNSDLAPFCVFQNPSSGYVPFDTNYTICVSTVHGAKGLEFRALHILACETFRKHFKLNRNLTFTGVTRAKTSLSLYYSGDIYAYLESALATLFPRTDRPNIAEAFGRR